jgi:hypothetical protein
VTFAEFQGATILGGRSPSSPPSTSRARGAGIYLADLDSGTSHWSRRSGVHRRREPCSRSSASLESLRRRRVRRRRGAERVLLTHGIFRSAGGTLSSVALEGDPRRATTRGRPSRASAIRIVSSLAESGGFSANVHSSPCRLQRRLPLCRRTGELIAAQAILLRRCSLRPFSVESPGASFQRSRTPTARDSSSPRDRVSLRRC